MYRFEKILYKTGLNPIQRFTHMCNIFYGEYIEAFLSLAMYLCGINYFDDYVVGCLPLYNDLDICLNC